MKRWLPYPLLWALLLAMWLALEQAVAPADIALGAVVCLGAVHALRVLQLPPMRLRRPVAMARLAALFVSEVLRSNVAVARIVARAGTRRRSSGFLDIPLELRHPAALAVLACILTSTPGTIWARYDARRQVLTMHILDLIDEETWMHLVKRRYEPWLLEIFE